MVILFVIIGIILASFYGVVGYRLSNSESIVNPPSHCEKCNKRLKWYDLIPVFSYIILRGKCRYCGKKLSILYLLTEIISGILFGIGYYIYGLNYELLLYLIIVSLMIIIFISDFNYLVILDSPTIIAIILTIIIKFIIFGFNTTIHYILTGIILFVFMYIIKIIGDHAFKRESLGGGDIKLALFIGLILGLKLSLVTVVLASFIALPYSLIYVIKKQDKEVPFGPFLIMATLICFVFSDPINSLLNLLFVL